MSWIPMLPWYQWLIIGLVPPLIFSLYFLKLRRVPLEVPSTYLWAKTVEDLHVNSIWQRLRKNLLLLFQLLAAGLLIAACFNPGCEGEQLEGGRYIFVVDQSASMSATDLENGKSRLEEAKDQVATLIDRMQTNDAAMVISFSDRAVVQQSYTKSKSQLKQKVKSIRQTERASDINEALVAASGLANPGRTSTDAGDIQVADELKARLFIFSDGAIRPVSNFSAVNLEVEYRPIGSFEPPANVGITAFSINDILESDTQTKIFARLQNSGMEDAEVDLSLFVADKRVDARKVSVPGRDATPLNFDLSPFVVGLEEATPIRLMIETPDVYSQDNEAYCVLNPPQLAKVLVVSDYPRYLELALSTDRCKKLASVQYETRTFLEDNKYAEAATLGLYDLIVYDQCFPKELPNCNTVFFGSVPDGNNWKVLETLETTAIVDTNAGHPLMYDVPVGSVYIATSTTLEGPKGSLPLIESARGTVMMIGPRGGFEDLVIGFPLVTYNEDGIEFNTNFYKQLGFPVFMQNMLTTLGGNSRFDAMRANEPGELVTIKTPVPYPAVVVKDPRGETTTISSRADNTFVYSQTDQSGLYEVAEKASGSLEQIFAINLLDRTESDLNVQDQLRLGYEEVAAIDEAASKVPARKNYWWWLALLTLVVMTIEWIIYNRRVFI